MKVVKVNIVTPALIAIETNPDFIDGNKRISWECR